MKKIFAVIFFAVCFLLLAPSIGQDMTSDQPVVFLLTGTNPIMETFLLSTANEITNIEMVAIVETYPGQTANNNFEGTIPIIAKRMEDRTEDQRKRPEVQEQNKTVTATV